MIYLFLSIACASAIFLIFRAYRRFRIHTFTAIVINYLVAALFGFTYSGAEFNVEKIIHSDWLINAVILGFIFIVMFNVMALTTQKFGASVGSIANKMALIVPVIFAIVYYGDRTGWLKIAGIVLALLGILLSTLKPKTMKKDFKVVELWLPATLLIGSGFIDTFVKYSEQYYLKTDEDSRLFSSMIFFTAFLLGTLAMVVDRRKRSLQWKNLLGGLALGLVNFGSIYFLLLTFKYSRMESSVIFPLNNMGVVMTTSFVSFLIFRERFSRMNQLGILICLISVALIAWGR